MSILSRHMLSAKSSEAKRVEAMLSESDIFAALRDCFDPEVKLNLVDLGLIYAIETGPDPDSTPAWPRQWVKVTMTLTTPQCPAIGSDLRAGTQPSRRPFPTSAKSM